jgi:hypothetical protein
VRGNVEILSGLTVIDKVSNHVEEITQNKNIIQKKLFLQTNC